MYLPFVPASSVKRFILFASIRAHRVGFPPAPLAPFPPKKPGVAGFERVPPAARFALFNFLPAAAVRACARWRSRRMLPPSSSEMSCPFPGASSSTNDAPRVRSRVSGHERRCRLAPSPSVRPGVRAPRAPRRRCARAMNAARARRARRPAPFAAACALSPSPGVVRGGRASARRAVRAGASCCCRGTSAGAGVG